MSSKVIEILLTETFKKNFKSLRKKYISIDKDLSDVIEELKINPNYGTSLGNNCFKVRIKINSKNKGKSSGARLITFYRSANNIVYLLTIYDKSNISSITPTEINEIINSI